VHLEASTKPHVHKKIREFLINMAFTMAYPNFKKGMNMDFGPLGVNSDLDSDLKVPSLYWSQQMQRASSNNTSI
jgi:hypothetical protein